MTGVRQGELLALRWGDVNSSTEAPCASRRTFVASSRARSRFAGLVASLWRLRWQWRWSHCGRRQGHPGPATSSAAIRSRASRWIATTSASAFNAHVGERESALCGFTIFAIRSGRESQPPATCRSGRCRSGWATAIRRRHSSTPAPGPGEKGGRAGQPGLRWAGAPNGRRLSGTSYAICVLSQAHSFTSSELRTREGGPRGWVSTVDGGRARGVPAPANDERRVSVARERCDDRSPDELPFLTIDAHLMLVETESFTSACSATSVAVCSSHGRC